MEKSKRRKSIVTDDLNHCFLCGSRAQEIHHLISGTANRKLSDEDGLIIPICRVCHQRIHEDSETNRQSKEFAQRAWMKWYKMTEDDFRKRYGKSFLRVSKYSL